MCIFAGPARVSNTNIFVGRHQGRQVTVYEMEATGFSGVNAMLLPVPAARAEEVELISMEDKPDFFEKLTEATRERTRGMYLGLPTKAIPVQRVGSYDVSVATFAELRAGARFADSFKVSPAAWQTLEAYNRRGSHVPYVVLVAQLRAGEKRHPLAYSHPIYLSGGLFVPTVHEHGEGAVSWPQWDHTIFTPPGAPVYQLAGGSSPGSPRHHGQQIGASALFVQAGRGPTARDVEVMPGYRAPEVQRLTAYGPLPNVDLFVLLRAAA